MRTLTRRYSDRDGYWLFGFIVDDSEQLSIDLLNTSSIPQHDTAIAYAVELAHTKLREQIRKAGLEFSCIRQSTLAIFARSHPRRLHRCCLSTGYDVRFLVRVISDLGKTYESEKVVFVLSHNPNVELRSTRCYTQL